MLHFYLHESRNDVVKLSLKPSENLVRISGDSPDIGTVEEEVVTLPALDGNDLEISFNPNYMKDAFAFFWSGNDQDFIYFTIATIYLGANRRSRKFCPLNYASTDISLRKVLYKFYKKEATERFVL